MTFDQIQREVGRLQKQFDAEKEARDKALQAAKTRRR